MAPAVKAAITGELALPRKLALKRLALKRFGLPSLFQPLIETRPELRPADDPITRQESLPVLFR